MSSASPFRSPTDVVPSQSTDLRTLAVRPVQFAGFWTAVFAPLAYPVLLFGGLAESQVLLLAGVFLANVLGLVLGRGYRAEE
ncbi:hypothetical protein [Haloarcula litorea]|uniref:hypothetical protein n=1 Tax=Haloarcula litorea TaxID=3032579 RepID=UPI0023E87D38|nr:hypothetical protein [Halomicroarcula sp. GDY20]